MMVSWNERRKRLLQNECSGSILVVIRLRRADHKPVPLIYVDGSSIVRPNF